MPLDSLDIKTEYRSFRDNIVQDFYVPILRESISYKRAVGFFSSSALSEIARGLATFIINSGTIQLIASPYLSNDDIKAINEGYIRRNEIIKAALFRGLTASKDYFESERLNLLSNLIADGSLDIKIAIAKDDKGFGMYHEKMGIFFDSIGNKIAFYGSMNETATAFYSNFESIDVACTWHSSEQKEKVLNKEYAFNRIWTNEENGIISIDFPDLKKEIIDRYKRSSPNYQIDEEEKEQYKIFNSTIKNNNFPIQPLEVTLRDYQIEAINNWAKSGYRGIFDMATGTGKTITGLGAVTYLSKELDNKLAVFIVCPYQHLVEQWVEDIEAFNIRPIIGYSASYQIDWKKRLEYGIRDQKLGVKDKQFFCFISTNATFSSSFVQNQIAKISSEILLLIDEAHNFGAKYLSGLLSDRYDYRLALSATIDRFRDEEGTATLNNFFGKKCIEYTLQQAIEAGKLTEYIYYPVICVLKNVEKERYLDLTIEIKKCITKDKNGKVKLNDRGKRLALERARLVAGSTDKIFKLEEKIQLYIGLSHILVYCGATKSFDYKTDFTDIEDFDKRQIDIVTDLLGNKLGMKVSQFTSREDIKEREKIKFEFTNGEYLKVLIAIKCLDEGVNIPAINTAFILASTSNPKEYIQRRGRVLRLFPGKEHANIYDFITLPYSLEDTSSLTQLQIDNVIGLVKNELQRCSEFSKLARNKYESESVINKIKEAYHIDDFKIDLEEFYNYVE